MRRQRGYSLIELMVASTVGLLLLAAMLFVFTGSRQGARQTEAMARTQENARIAVELLSAEIRMAGLAGCRSRGTGGGREGEIEIRVADLPFTAADLHKPVLGTVYRAGVPAFVDDGELRGVAGSHVLTLRKSLPSMLALADDFSAAAGNLQLRDRDARADLRDGDLLLVDDCVRSQLVRARNVSAPDGGGVRHIEVDALPSVLPYIFSSAHFAEVTALREEAYFVRASGRRNSAGRPQYALFRMRDGAVEEVVDGVSNLRVRYALGDDGAVEAFVHGEEMDEADWKRVLAVRVELLLEADAANVLPDPVAVEFDGEPLAASTDLRSVVQFTVALRNRAR